MNDKGNKKRLYIARNNYVPRMLAALLAFLCVAGALYERQAPSWIWLLQGGLLGVVWPQVAWALSRRAKDTAEAEKRNLLFDHLILGMGIAATGFNTLPTALLTSIAALDNMLGSADLRLLPKGLLFQAGGMIVGALIYGMDWRPHSSMLEIMACLPMMLVHPLLVGRIMMRAVAKLKEQRAYLARLSTRDPLSDLYNRRHMDECIRIEFQRYLRSGEKASLALIDFDHFKRINDTLGHDGGDEVIRRFGNQLQRNLRATDTPGRFGGEEFVVLLPGTNRHEAGALMQRLQSRLAAEPLPDGRALTVSVGIAELNRDLPTPEAWVRLTDQMLYRAKHQGRNRVVMASEEELNAAATTAPSANDEKVELPIEPYVLAALEYGDIAAALFDPADRVAWANERFRVMHHMPDDGRQTFGDIIRHNHAHRVGLRIEADDIDAWLTAANAKRRKLPRRGFVVDTCDGRLHRVEEFALGDGWLFYLSMPHWELSASTADVVPALAAAS
jgi:diguanylate cyclase (GGDEF)-like protein